MWIGRKANGTIYGSWTSKPPVDADHPLVEELADNHPDVIAYLAPLPPTQYELDSVAAKAYAKLTALKAMTPAQVDVWVTANVNTLAEAKDAIKTLAIAVSVLSRRL